MAPEAFGGTIAGSNLPAGCPMLITLIPVCFAGNPLEEKEPIQ